MFPFALDPAQEFTAPKMCTDTGAYHQWIDGEFLSMSYGEDFFPSNYSASDVYVQTSHELRTIESARAQLEGIFQDKLIWPEVDSSFSLNTVHDAEDLILHLSPENCPRMQ